MKALELKKLLADGGLEKYSSLYADIPHQTERFISAIDKFTDIYGYERDIEIFSVPGRSEIMGNHTDHNRGCVLAGAIDRDIIAVAAKRDDGIISFTSEGFGEIVCDLSLIDNPDNFQKYTSKALIAGLCKGFTLKGYSIGGYDAYATSEVLKGSGISSSAAFEVMIGNILNYVYCDGKVKNSEIAKISQYAENTFFGKPCGLMDQMACAVGGLVYIDLENPQNPTVEPIDFSLTDKGYSLCIINTGGNHADLNDDYASVPREMKDVAAALGCDYLRETNEEKITEAIPLLRGKVGDRALLRALHFMRENRRVNSARDALKRGDLQAFLECVRASGASSFQYLQNVYTTANVKEQGLSLALTLADGYLDGKYAAFRVHGGGFAGTVQVFIENSELNGFSDFMDCIFGKGSAMKLRIRPIGATKLF